MTAEEQLAAAIKALVESMSISEDALRRIIREEIAAFERRIANSLLHDADLQSPPP
jgi:predicted component of type VI protein secretion system